MLCPADVKEDTTTIMVTDAGFTADTWTSSFVPLAAVAANDSGPDLGIDMTGVDAPQGLADVLHKLSVIRIDFPTNTDGRGVTRAARLRRI